MLGDFVFRPNQDEVDSQRHPTDAWLAEERLKLPRRPANSMDIQRPRYMRVQSAIFQSSESQAFMSTPLIELA